MGAVIGQLNSIRFREVNSNLPSFDNTLLRNEQFYNDKIFTYCQRWQTTDTVIVQVKSDSDTVPTVIATKADKTTSVLTATLKTSYDTDSDAVNDLFFFEFSVVMSSFLTETYITVTQGTDIFISEPFHGDADLTTELTNAEVLQIDYYNFDNAFQIDFSTGITYTIYINAVVKDYEFGGESSNYDNQDEITKLKETAQRLFSFKTLEIPRYLAETIRLSSSCDNFNINEVAYVRQDLPELTPVEGSNLVDYTMTINDKEYLGVNSHDIGYDCDTPATNSEVMVLLIENASGGETFSITGGYLIHTLKAEYVSGTTVEVKLGTTVGTQDLVIPFDLTASITGTNAQVHADESESNYDIYATVTGGVANLTLQLIKNIE